MISVGFIYFLTQFSKRNGGSCFLADEYLKGENEEGCFSKRVFRTAKDTFDQDRLWEPSVACVRGRIWAGEY